MLKIDFSKNVKFCNFFSVKLSCHKFRQFSSSVKMADVEKAKLKAAIELYYTNNKSKDKKNDTYHHFKGYKHNGTPIYNKQSLYRLMRTLDDKNV